MSLDTLSFVLNGLTSAVFIIDNNRCILRTNSAADTLFGEGLAGSDFVQVVRHPDCLRSIEDVLNGKTAAQSIFSIQKPVRTTYKVNVTAFGPGPFSEEDDTSPRAVISFDDISHIREAEQMRSDFVANVSHELRSPLTALSGFIETLKGAAKQDPEARERFLDIMEREAQRMNRLIGDLLSLSRVEVNEHVRPTTPVDVVLIIRKVIATLSSQAEKEQKELCLETPASPIAVIPGDDDELTQVFHNLIENAIRYGGPQSQVLISMKTSDQVPGMQGEVLIIDVCDSGDGIAPEHIARLTERFYRVDDSRSRNKGGTGLGLAIIKHILNHHRGRLQIQSEVGVGSTFTVYLPMAS